MGQPLISVIIPVYNIKDYLPNCLNSIIKQSYTNLEILIIDDGSTDGTAELCDGYANEDNRVKVIHKDNEGQAVARNLGISQAQGELIAFIDGDDWVCLDYFSVLYTALIENGADIINCNFVRTSVINKVNATQESYKTQIYNSEQAIENLCYLRELNCAPVAKLFKKGIWDSIRFPEGYIYEDLAVIYQTFHYAKTIAYIDYDGYYYYQRGGSSLNNKFSERKLSRVDFSEEIYDFIKISYPNIIASGACRLFWSASGALMDIPLSYRNMERKHQILADLRHVRRTVAHDNKCKFTIRVLAMLSYMGCFGYQCVLKLYQRFKG